MDRAEKMDCRSNGEVLFTGATTKFQLRMGLTPANYCIADSLRNLQYLLSILWVKKANPVLLQGRKKPRVSEIFRISLVK